jgi:DNA-binding NarL/FixJ family response regulator
MTIRILLADDHPLMREALLGAIEDEDDMQVVGEAGDGLAAIRLARETHPDIIVMDLFMPVKDGLSASEEILAGDASAHILVFTSSQEEEKITAAVEAGVLGYLNKDVQRVELLHAIREVSQGRAYLPPAIATRLVSGLRKKKSADFRDENVDSLTPRELEITAQVKQGLTNQQIASALTLSEGTVRTHVHNILQKLGLQNRNQLILYRMQEDKR